jgi:hypothetical protein
VRQFSVSCSLDPRGRCRLSPTDPPRPPARSRVSSMALSAQELLRPIFAENADSSGSYVTDDGRMKDIVLTHLAGSRRAEGPHGGPKRMVGTVDTPLLQQRVQVRPAGGPLNTHRQRSFLRCWRT